MSGGIEPVLGALKDFQRSTRSSGNITINSTSFIDLDNGLDLVLTAAAGDVIEVGMNAAWSSQVVNGVLDVATIVGGSPVNYISNGTATPATGGIAGWYGASGAFVAIGAPRQYVVQAGDVSAGQVRLRLRTKTDTATNKILVADTGLPIQFRAINLGQVGGWAAIQSGTLGLLSYKEYQPGSLATYTTSSATYANVDATNLILPNFTAPASGYVIVVLTGLITITAIDQVWAIQDGSGIVTGSDGVIASSGPAGPYIQLSHRRRIAVTPGATISAWKWAWKRTTSGTATMYSGGTTGALTVMEVWAA